MDKLPNEILHNIFVRVPFEQRLESMYVCRQWCNTLQRRSLLNDIEIDGMELYDDFMNMLHDIPNRGDQVEVLHLQIEPNDEFDYQEFCTMLPNLHELHFENNDYSSEESYNDDKPPNLKYTNSKLEFIKETAQCELTRRLMASNTFTRLRSLELQFDEMRNLGKSFFVYLENAPALENLTLSCYIRIEDCEILHKSVPGLKTLHLKYIVIDPGALPHDIIPATTVNALSMNIAEVEDHNTYSNWYKYLAKKYTNMMHFNLRDDYILEADPEETTTIYDEWVLPLYKNTEKQLDTFNALNVPTELDIFKKLDECGVGFETIILENNRTRPIFTQLAESNLPMNAKNITLIRTDIPSPIMLHNFVSLRHLRIDSDETDAFHDFNLTDYLNALPLTLHSLSIYFDHAGIGELPVRSNNIQDFYLDCDVISPKLGEILSNYFPNLTKLNLSGLITEDLNIDLPRNHFEQLYISAYFEGDITTGFSIMDAESSRPDYYIGEMVKVNYGYITVPATAQDLQHRVNVNIKYAIADVTSYTVRPIGLKRF